ncbi:MAG: dihydropyrimidinase [Sedimentibacter sp.]
MNLIIKNGIINNCEESFKSNILIGNGLIKQIGTNLNNENNYEIIDANENLILPGGVDVHTHMDLDLGKYRAIDDFYTGTLAAAYGGTTTIVDHISFGPKGCSLHYEIEEYHKLAIGKTITDYSFHGVIQHVDENILNEMNELVDEGIQSFKIYMTYDNMLNDEEILRVLIKAKELGVVIAVHAENHGTIQYLRSYFGNQRKTEPIYHALSRPDSSEAEAINRMIYLSEIAGYPHLYFVHVSTKKGLDEIKAARNRGVKNIYCETCTQYLTLTDDCYNKENYEGLKYIMAPPLRKKEDVESLWSGIENDIIDVIATDHCPFYLEQKLMGRDDFRVAPGGAPGVEERIAIILTEGLKRGLSINKLIEKLCSNPAKIFGLYPKKGSLNIGSEADIVIVKKEKNIISQNNMHGAADYSAYEGYEAEYIIETVIQRGNILIKNGELFAAKGDGEFIKRKRKED